MPYTPPLYTSNGVGCISNNGNQSVTLSEDGFQLSTNLLTTPIVVTISENGLSTTNPNGLEVISPLNMTGNNIFNVDTITYPDNTQFTIQNPLSVGQGELKIYSDSTNPSTSSIFLNAETININCGSLNVGGNLNMSGLNIDAVNNINLNTINGMSPTTIGLTWNDFNANNAWTNLPNNQYELNNYMGGQSILSVDKLLINNYTDSISIQINTDNIKIANGNNGYNAFLTSVGGLYSANGLGLDTQHGNALIGDINNSYNKTNILVNDVHREIDLNAVDILSNVGGSIYYTLPINFTMKWNGNYNYSQNNNWEMVQHNQMNLPVEYFTLTGAQTAWRYEFAINCFNCNNQTDRAYAMYLEFVDNNSNAFQSFCFNYNTPFTTHKNNSTYSATSNAVENYCYTDHIDFTGSSGGPFDIRLWRYGDNNYTCDFNAILTLSKTNLV